jgi:hypothetical protein
LIKDSRRTTIDIDKRRKQIQVSKSGEDIERYGMTC